MKYVFLYLLFILGSCSEDINVEDIVQQVEDLINNFNEDLYPVVNGYRGQRDEYGHKEGVGILRNPNGDYHIGQWKRDIRHGLGKSFVKETGDTYLGEFRFDNQHGIGMLTTVDGDRYEGEWVVGNQEGDGTYTWADGSSYNGQWRDGNPNGWGTWENAELRHTGQWVNGKRHGQGTVTKKKNGKIAYSGEFVDDKPTNKALMVKNGIVQTRSDAVELGRVSIMVISVSYNYSKYHASYIDQFLKCSSLTSQIFTKQKIFHHVTKDHDFEDKELYYRFGEDEAKVHGNVPDDVQTWAKFLPSTGERDEDDNDIILQPKMKLPDDNMLATLDELDVKPLDKYNIELLDKVHPAKWINPEPSGTYNMLVIGAGAGGLVTAAGSAGCGARVAIIEKHLLGGDCLNVGCVPSKALLRAAHVAAAVKNASKYGVHIKGEVEINFPEIMERMRRLRSEISHNDSAERFADELGVDVFIGEAKFISKDSVQVGDKVLKFAKACIATGGRPAIPPIPGLKDTPYLTNTTIFNLTELPKRLAVIGTGPIGCELAQAFTRFGSKVTLLNRSKQILGREDPDAADILYKQFIQEGITIVSLDFKSVSVVDKNKVITIVVNGEEKEILADEILVSTGRVPNIENLGLENAGVKYDKQGVKVNDHLQTSNNNIFAVGDVCTQYKFTHMSDSMARIVIRNALFINSGKLSALTIPWATYTEPEIAHVGLYDQDIKDKGLKCITFKRAFEHVDRAKLDEETDGFVKVHVKEGTDQILGCTIVNNHAGDMISEVTMAMHGKLGLSRIAAVIHPYPTQAECIRQLGDEYNRTRLTPTVKVLFRTLMAAKR